MTMQATALAHPNIAFIKYWGLRDEALRLPANDSLSMNIGCLNTTTSVTFDDHFKADVLVINKQQVTGKALVRVSRFLDRLRQKAKQPLFAAVESTNNFPIGAGLASSASAFAALVVAGSGALGLSLTEKELSSLARFGSGSACRSIPGGFVEWRTNQASDESYAFSIAPHNHWQLVDCIVILSKAHKAVGSEAGMRSAVTSPLQNARIADTPRRLALCRSAILQRDFGALARVTELDSNMMHAVMMTSDPPLFYWHPASLEIIKAIQTWQIEGLTATYTLDAGPNVHVICPQENMSEVLSRLREFPGVIDILKGMPAGPARLLP